MVGGLPLPNPDLSWESAVSAPAEFFRPILWLQKGGLPQPFCELGSSSFQDLFWPLVAFGSFHEPLHELCLAVVQGNGRGCRKNSRMDVAQRTTSVPSLRKWRKFQGCPTDPFEEVRHLCQEWVSKDTTNPGASGTSRWETWAQVAAYMSDHQTTEWAAAPPRISLQINRSVFDSSNKTP